MIKIAICDDNAVQLCIAQEELEKNLKEGPDYSVDVFDNALSFSNILQSGTCPYDIIFMDIELGNSSVSGIDLIHKVNFLNPDCQVIYISQHLEYSSDVYDTHHVYFLSKDRLSELIGKSLKAAIKALDEINSSRYFYFKSRKMQYKIPQNEILYMERNLRETTIVTVNKEFRLSEKIDQILQRLPSNFVSCHRSYAINLKMINSIHQGSVSFPDGRTVPISRTHYSDVKKAFALLNSYML